MTLETDIAVIGAGPYGLSLAAHLAAARQDVRVFGKPMHFWRNHMPEGMVLKSEGFASNLSDPDGAFTLRDYCAAQNLPYKDSGLPVPLQTFCDYGQAFQARFVPQVDTRTVTKLDGGTGGFLLQFDDGTAMTAERVVLATGIGSFDYIPPELRPLGPTLCTHSAQHRSLDAFIGKEVLVVGGGASGVEIAGLLSEKGIRVTVAARQDPISFCGPPRQRTLLEKIQAPETGLGTGWRSLACVTAPMVFYAMPQSFRHFIVRKHLGPAPGWTSRAAVERGVTTMLGATPAGAEIHDGLARVRFALAHGLSWTTDADHVIAATGYRVDMRRLGFISPAIMDRLRLAENTPVLSPWFETSVPGLFTVGALAANSFGPLLRFVYGADFASRRLSRHLDRTARRPARTRALNLAPA